MIDFWWSALVRTSVSLSIATIVAVLLLRWQRPTSPRIHQFVWALVLLQGIAWVQAPIRVPRTTAHRPIESVVEEPIREDRVQPAESEPGSFRKPATVAASSPPIVERNEPPNALSRFDWRSAALGVWCSGIGLCLALGILQYVLFRRRLRLAVEAPLAFEAELREEAAAVGVSSRLALLVDESLGPLLCRTRGGNAIVVPRTVWNGLEPSQRRMILRHELAHLKRGDLWKSLAARLALTPQWFNPFAWFALRRFDEAAEWACDELAAPGIDARPRYASALLSLCESRPSLLPQPSAANAPVSHRIRRLLCQSSEGDSVMKRFVVVLLPVVALAAALIQLKPAASLQAAEPPPKSAPGEKKADPKTPPTAANGAKKPKSEQDTAGRRATMRREYQSISIRSSPKMSNDGDALYWALTAVEADAFPSTEANRPPHEGDWEFVNMLENLGRRRWTRNPGETTVQMIDRHLLQAAAEKANRNPFANWRDHEPLLKEFLGLLLDCVTAGASRPEEWAKRIAADSAHATMWRRGYQAALRIAADASYPRFELLGVEKPPEKSDPVVDLPRVKQLATVVRTLLLADVPLRRTPPDAGANPVSFDQLFQELLGILKRSSLCNMGETAELLGELHRDLSANPRFRTPAGSLREVVLESGRGYAIEAFYTHAGFSRREVFQAMRDQVQPMDVRNGSIHDAVFQLSQKAVFSIWIDEKAQGRNVNLRGTGKWSELLQEAVSQAGLASAELEDGLVWIGPDSPDALREAKSTLRRSNARCTLAGEQWREKLQHRTATGYQAANAEEVFRFLRAYHDIDLIAFVPNGDEWKLTDNSNLPFHLWLTLRLPKFGMDWLPLADALIVAEPARIADIQRRVSATQARLRSLWAKPESTAIAEKLRAETPGGFDNAILEGVMDFLSKYHSIPIMIEDGKTSVRTRCNLNNTSFATILDVFCADTGFDWEVKDGKIVVKKQ